MARTSRSTFVTWFTDNFLTGNPANITAAKMREFGNRIADNLRNTIATGTLTAPQVIVGVNDTIPMVVGLDSILSSNTVEIEVVGGSFAIQPLIDVYFGLWVYQVKATVAIEGVNGDVVILGIYDAGTLIASMQVELKGAGVPQIVEIPPTLFTLIAANDLITLELTTPTGALPVTVTVDAALLQVATAPGMI